MSRYINYFANTSLDEETLAPMSAQHGTFDERSARRQAQTEALMRGASAADRDDSEEAYDSDSSDEYRLDLPSGMVQSEEWDVVIARQEAEDREKERAEHREAKAEKKRKGTEAIYNELTKHIDKREGVQKVCQDALEDWKNKRPERYAKFVEHFKLATQIAETEVRIHDIASWYKSGMPHDVKEALTDLREHLHVQCFLQRRYIHAAGLCQGEIDHVKDEEQYAADNYHTQEKLGYGNEDDFTHPENPKAYHLSNKIGHSLAEPTYIRQWLTAWTVRWKHASKNARYPGAPWEKSVDGILHDWIQSVLDSTRKAKANGEYKQMQEVHWAELHQVRYDLKAYRNGLMKRKAEIDAKVHKPLGG